MFLVLFRAALSNNKNTLVAAAIARPPRTTVGARAGIGRKDGVLWRVFRLSAQPVGSERADLRKRVRRSY